MAARYNGGLMITRRKAMKKLGVLGGAVALAPHLVGCADDGPVSSTAGGPGGGGGGSGGGGSGGGGSGPSGPPITHIVCVCMENRSYDHYLGARSLLEGKPGDGLRAGMTNPSASGGAATIHRAAADCVADPPHGWDSSHLQWNDGQCDGFVREYEKRQGASVAPHVMGYQTREELPITWALADAYTSCDRYFASVMGPTWPNRMYWMAGQSFGMKANDFPPGGQFDGISIFHRAMEKGIPWSYYFNDLPALALVKGLSESPDVRYMKEFFEGARAGNLPPVSYVDPAFSLSDDHPPHHPILGQMFLLSIYEALAASPLWGNTLLVITYDEHGGFFDHVSPPKVPDDRASEGFDQLGFRVPALVIGPYAREGHVSSVTRDHTSVLRHVQNMFGLDPLTMRVSAANDLSETLDEVRLSSRKPRAAAPMPALMVDESMIDAACNYRASERTDLEKAMDDGKLPRHLDRRAQVRESIELGASELRRLGKGGFARLGGGRLWELG
jgi:phospholipase C